MDLILSIIVCVLVAVVFVQDKRIRSIEKRLFVDENFE